jgi:hypothetical protein
MRHEILDDPFHRVLSNFNEMMPQILILPVANVNGVVTAGAWLASRRRGLKRRRQAHISSQVEPILKIAPVA